MMLLFKMIIYLFVSWYLCGVATDASRKIINKETGPAAVWFIVAFILTLVAAVLF